jgi:hypothetical protein
MVQGSARVTDKAQQTGQSVATTTHPIIQAILSLSQSPEEITVLVGYFGPSPTADYVRLYFSLDFRSYCELHNPQGGGGDILGTLPANPSNPNSPTLVFISADTVVTVARTTSVDVQASFLRGAIASANLGAAAGLGVGGSLGGDHCFNHTLVVYGPITRPHCP